MIELLKMYKNVKIFLIELLKKLEFIMIYYCVKISEYLVDILDKVSCEV